MEFWSKIPTFWPDRKKTLVGVFSKILGCRDPRCKHENPSITIMFDESKYVVKGAQWS